MSTYKPNIPSMFKSEKEFYNYYIKGRKLEIAKYLTGNFVKDYNFMIRLNQQGRK
jgi:hypothetical protein